MGKILGMKNHMQSQAFLDRRCSNRLLSLWEAQKQKEILKSLPPSIKIPFEAACNSRCVFCNHEHEDKRLTSSSDSFSFRRYLILREPLDNASTIALGTFGEPFMHRGFIRILNFIQNNYEGAKIAFSSNGTLLNEELIRKINMIRKLYLNISVNAADARTYAKIAGVNAFHRVIRNIRLLDNIQKRNKGLTLMLSYVLIKQNIAGVPDFINLAASLNIREVSLTPLIITHARLNEYSLDDIAQKAHKILRRAASIARHYNIRLRCYNAGGGIEAPGVVSESRCYYPWREFNIKKNGDVFFCNSNIIAGNVFRQDISEIWNGKIYRIYRATVNTENILPICMACPVKDRNIFSFRKFIVN
jgi:MoaA/NifB/PqqE/SkfB family radical SAM enzyme